MPWEAVIPWGPDRKVAATEYQETGLPFQDVNELFL